LFQTIATTKDQNLRNNEFADFKLITFNRTGYFLLCNAAQSHFWNRHFIEMYIAEKKTIQNQFTKMSFYMQLVLNLSA
jgi:hypothetical protein